MNQNQQKQKNSNRGIDQFAKYSGLAFQMLIIILIFVWAGDKLDEKFMGDRKLFIILFSVLGVFLGLYIALKDFITFTRKK